MEAWEDDRDSDQRWVRIMWLTVAGFWITVGFLLWLAFR